MRRGRFLFVLWEGGGTNPPELALASRLVARGHVVRVLGDPTIGPDAAASGASFVPYRVAPHRTTRTRESEIIADWQARTPLGAFARARDRHAFRPAAAFAKETLAAHAAFGADAVVVDAMLFGGLVGAEASGSPWAALIPMASFLPAPGRPPAALGLQPKPGALGRVRDRAILALGDRFLWASCLPLLNRARAEVGLGPVSHPLDQIRRATRILVMTSPTFDFDAPRACGNLVYTGPELSDPAWARGVIRDAPPGARPSVLVALSSTYQAQEPLLGRILDAVAGLDVHAVVTLGPALGANAVSGRSNVSVMGCASHAELLPSMSAAITHGGHGTVLRALAAGVPLVVLPMGRDQADNGARVVKAGAGVRISARSRVPAIRLAIRRVLGDEHIRAGAKRMASVLAREAEGGDRAVDALEALVAG